MTQNEISKFLNALQKCKTEEDIKSVYAKHLNIIYDTSLHIDLYTTQVLFEFKLDKNFRNLKIRSQIIAQTLYYVRRLKYGGFIDKPIPPFLCFANQNEAILTETVFWRKFYDDERMQYDWDLAPSTPDKHLIEDISNEQLTKDIHIYTITELSECRIFTEQLKKALQNQLSFGFTDKKVITEDNFEDVFEYWNKIFGDSVRNGFKTSRYFVSDIQKDNTIFLKEESKAFFRIGHNEIKEKKILTKDYEHFWSLYEKITNVDIVRAILAKIDRLTDETMRRFHGEFFTPIRFAKKALDYIEKTVGRHWWQLGEYRLWDMAAGTGNLEYHLPQEALKYCYLSTLYKEDTEHLIRLFPDATVFQYDYLNDDVENVFVNKTEINFTLTWKLPKKLRNDLDNPNIKWIILINPPFAMPTAGMGKGSNKQGSSETNIRKTMHREKLGNASEELFTQFLFRIKFEFKDKRTHLGLFSTLKYINASNSQKFRNDVFNYFFVDGFIFSSANFSGTKANNAFPVGFLLWDLSKEQQLEFQNVKLDIFSERVEKIGKKQIKTIHRDNFLSKWLIRPKQTTIFPSFSSAIKVKIGNKGNSYKVAKNFLMLLMCAGNDYQHQNNTAFLSGSSTNHDGVSVTPENFEQAMVVHAARRVPKATWINDRDQFMKPNQELSEEFIIDCTVWNLFSNSNNTAALRNIKYEGTIYQIHNHFFPFRVHEVKKWKISDSDIKFSLATAEDTFVARWFENKTFSTEAKVVMNKGKEVYQFYFAHLNKMRTTKFKIETWDAGWWQIRQAMNDENLCRTELKELKALHDALKEKILEGLKKYGIIDI